MDVPLGTGTIGNDWSNCLKLALLACYVTDYMKFAFPGCSYFSFQPVLHDWCNKGCGLCYPVCGMVHIKEPLLLIGKSSLCGGSRFPLSLSEWSFTICLLPMAITMQFGI